MRKKRSSSLFHIKDPLDLPLDLMSIMYILTKYPKILKSSILKESHRTKSYLILFWISKLNMHPLCSTQVLRDKIRDTALDTIVFVGAKDMSRC